MAIHYVNAILTKLGGDSYLDRILSPEGRLEVTQYIYDLKTHEISTIHMDLGEDDEDEEGLEGFDKIASPFKTVTHSSNPINFSEIGSLASRQAEAKNKAKSALSPTPKFSSKTYEVEVKDRKGSSDTSNAPSYREMKNAVKLAIKKFAKTRFTVDDLVADIQDTAISLSLTNLLSGSKSKDYSRDHIPGFYKAFTAFFKEKDIYFPSTDDDDKSVKTTVSEITTMTGVSAGGAFHEDFNLGPQPGDETNDEESDPKEATSVSTKLTGITHNNKHRDTPKVIITNLTEDKDSESIKTTLTGTSIGTNANDANEEDNNSKMTSFTGITEALNNKINLDDLSEGKESSRKTTLSGITVSNRNSIPDNPEGREKSALDTENNKITENIEIEEDA
jgi:hypothetical protein